VNAPSINSFKNRLDKRRTVLHKPQSWYIGKSRDVQRNRRNTRVWWRGALGLRDPVPENHHNWHK
jgi:hypothetical protein